MAERDCINRNSIISRFPPCSTPFPFPYRLDPAIDDLAYFPSSSSSSSSREDFRSVNHAPQQHQAQGLPYALRQLVAREIEVERMRKHEDALSRARREEEEERGDSKKRQKKAVAARPPTAKEVEGKDKVGHEGKKEEEEDKAVAAEKPLPNHLRQKLEAKKVDGKDAVAEKSPVDFFGRALDPEVLRRRQVEAGREEEQGRIISSDVWFRFKEGYNNAVRKIVRMRDLA